MEARRQQQIEQIEIIERTVTESCRPLAAAEAFSFQPQSSVRTSTEQFISVGDPAERRFQLTSERDAGQDPSLLYSPSGAGQSSSFLREPPMHQSTPQTSSIVNQYGYDLHEVQTNDGGARIMETHGAGHLMLDRSLADASGSQQQRSPPSADRQRSILKQPGQQQPGVAEGSGGDTSWRKSPSSESSVHRKDSYRRMQEAEQQQQPNLSFYGQSSNATILSKQSKQGGSGWTGRMFSGAGNDSFTRLKNSAAELSRQLREGQWTPRLVAALLLIGLFLVLLLLLLWFVLSAFFLSRSTYAFWLYPPQCEECQRLSGSSYRPPSKLYVHLHSPAQAHFELIGNPPFKSNSFTAVDFDTGYVAIADHALTDDRGRHTSCFLMQLDRTALPDMSVLVDALRKTYEEVHAQFGWQEYWQFTVEAVDSSFVSGKFKDRIEDCGEGVQWYLLKQSVYTKDESCSYCFDFCLPDYAVLRRQKYEDDVSLGIRRLNCFRLYVPEWSKYQPQSDSSGGHFGYPKHQSQNTQRDANGNWVNWQYGVQQQQLQSQPTSTVFRHRRKSNQQRTNEIN